MEDAGRAIKRVREELAKKDKANGTSVSESLDLANLVKKIDRGFFDAPADVLGSIRRRGPRLTRTRPSALFEGHPPNQKPRAISQTLLHVQQCWLEEGLKGTVSTRPTSPCTPARSTSSPSRPR